MRQEIREALTPGVWAMIEAMEVNSNEGIRVLSAEMNNSERSVLRTVYEDWKRFGKWEGI
jgi:nucleolar pre-ribosomal-associated protein 2